MSSNGNNPMDGDVYVDEFVLGGRDEGKTGRSYDGKKKKAITAVQLTFSINAVVDLKRFSFG